MAAATRRCRNPAVDTIHPQATLQIEPLQARFDEELSPARASERKADLAHDDYLSGWAVPLFKHDEKLRAQVADIVRGRGTRDDAEDAVRWAALFKGHWQHANGKTPVTLEYVAAAEAEATELLQMLDDDTNESFGSPRDLRRRAHTRWLLTYNELYHLGRYLLRADPEAAARLPGVSPERGEGEAPAPPVNPPAPPVVTPTAGTKNPK